MKVSELSAQHVGRQVRISDPGRVAVEGVLTRVVHEAVLVDERSLCEKDPRPVVAEISATLTVGGCTFTVADGDLAHATMNVDVRLSEGEFVVRAEAIGRSMREALTRGGVL